MALFKLNLARIRGCPPPGTVGQGLEEFGMPETEEFGVLNHAATDASVFATLVRKSQQAIQRLDETGREVTTAAVDKVTLYPFTVVPRRERLETYAGGPAGFEQVGAFLASSLALPVVVEPIELDVAAAVEQLAAETKRFQLRSVRVSEYAHNSYMAGPYAPKFLDSEHGREFLAEYAEFVTAARVRFQAPAGRANVTLTPKTCLTYSCAEDDQPHVQQVLRGLV